MRKNKEQRSVHPGYLFKNASCGKENTRTILKNRHANTRENISRLVKHIVAALCAIFKHLAQRGATQNSIAVNDRLVKLNF